MLKIQAPVFMANFKITKMIFECMTFEFASKPRTAVFLR